MAQTLLQLRDRAKQRADMESSGFISDAEWTTYLNASYARLYDLLIEKGQQYFVAGPYQFVTDGVNDRFTLPDGSGTYTLVGGGTAPALYKLLAVDLKWPGSPTGWWTMRPFNLGERNAGGYPAAQSAPGAGQTVQLWYAPRLTPLVANADTLDGISGWEEFVVVDAARKALIKEESDSAPLERELGYLQKSIEDAAAERDLGAPETVTDVYASAAPSLRYRQVGSQLWLRHWSSRGGRGYVEDYGVF